MKKPIKDMTTAEKQERIAHLTHKFYGVNERASLLLRGEMDGIEPDKCMLEWLKNIEVLEDYQCKLENEYATVVVPELRKIKRIFEYEQDRLLKAYANKAEKQTFVALNMTAKLDEECNQKMAELRYNQRKRIQEIEAETTNKLKESRDQLRNAFINAINHLYR